MVGDKVPSEPVAGSPVPGSRRRQIRLQIFAGAIVLLSGIIGGSAGTILVLGDRIMWHPRPHKPRTPAALAEKFRSKYGLNEQQTQEIKEILTRGFEQKEMIRNQMKQKDEQRKQEFIEAMREVLTPKQFEQWKRDFDARIRRFRERHASGGAAITVGKRTENRQVTEETDAVGAEQSILTAGIAAGNRPINRVTLAKQKIGYIGPNGEYYNMMPTEEQLGSRAGLDKAVRTQPFQS